MTKVEIFWVDSTLINHGGWVDKSDKEALGQKILHPSTTGYLIKSTKDKVVVCQSKNADQYQGILVIPKSAIKEMYETTVHTKLI